MALPKIKKLKVSAEGEIAYQDYGGSGDTVILLPGIGETKGSYRFLAPLLAEAGYHTVAADNRGQGDSSANFDDYSIEAMGADTIRLIEKLGARSVHLVGNSKAGATVVWVAIKKPRLVKSLTLIGPFARDVPIPLYMRLGSQVVMRSASLWDMYYKSLYKASPPKDFKQYRQALKQNLAEPGRLRALRIMAFSSSPEVNNGHGKVKAKTLVVMGTKDPDFKSPAEEAKIIAGKLRGKIEMIEGSGHYPQVEFPEKTAKILAKFFG